MADIFEAFAMLSSVLNNMGIEEMPTLQFSNGRDGEVFKSEVALAAGSDTYCVPCPPDENAPVRFQGSRLTGPEQ